MKDMRRFYEAWDMLDSNSAVAAAEFISCNSAVATAELQDIENQIDIFHTLSITNIPNFPVEDFFKVPFTHHSDIISGTKETLARYYYIHRTVEEHLAVKKLRQLIKEDAYHSQGRMPNNFTRTIKINLGDKTYDIDNDGKMATADLASYISETYGKRPIEHDINATLDAWFNNGSTVVKMATSETFQVKAIPVAPVIDEGYYLVGDMFNAEGVDGWNTVSAKQAFKHSDKDVYDDPIFTLTFETKEANQCWKVIPKKNIDAETFWAAGVVGPKIDGDVSMTGLLTSDGWKFIVNKDWPINLGGSIDNLEQDGANLTVAGNTIKLYPTRKTKDNIFCTVE